MFVRISPQKPPNQFPPLQISASQECGATIQPLWRRDRPIHELESLAFTGWSPAAPITAIFSTKDGRRSLCRRGQDGDSAWRLSALKLHAEFNNVINKRVSGTTLPYNSLFLLFAPILLYYKPIASFFEI